MDKLKLKSLVVYCSSRLLLIVGALGCPLVAATQSMGQKLGAPGSVAVPPLKQDMQGIFVPLSVALPYSFDASTFASSTDRAMLSKQLKQLADSAGKLSQHVKTKDPAFQFVARTLQRDATDVSRLFDAGQFEEARYILHNMTDSCIACHTALPESSQAPGAPAFFATIKVEDMPSFERAHYFVVARQYDDALRAYEAQFRTSTVPFTGALALPHVVEYLRLCINVKNDPARAARLIDSIAGEGKVARHVREQAARWSAALSKAAKAGILDRPDLSVANRLLAEGRVNAEFPDDRDGLVETLLANAIAERIVKIRAEGAPDLAGAYYVLGVSEARLGRPFWLSREANHLEWAIRLGPHAAFASKAYTRLEDIVMRESTPPLGVEIPIEAKHILADLRALMESADVAK